MRKVISNYFYTSIYQIFTLIVPFITTPYLARVLRVENVGKCTYSSSIVSYFLLFAQLGLHIYGKREVSYVKNDRTKVTNLFFQLFLIRCFLFFICGSIFLNVALRMKNYTILLLIYGGYLIANVFDIAWFFQGVEDFKIITIRNFIIRIINIIAILAFVKNSEDVYLYAIITVLTELISGICLWFGIKKYLNKFKFSIKGIGRHIKMSIIMFVPQIIISVYTIVDKIMLGAMTTDTQVGFYAQSEKIIKMSLTVITSMGMVMMPHIANLISQNKDENNRKIVLLLEEVSRWTWFLGLPLMFGLAGMATGFTGWFFGIGYEPVANLMRIISPIIIFAGFSDIFGTQYLVAANHIKEYNICVIIGAISNFIINYLLIPLYGAFGASIATVCSEFIVTVAMGRYCRKYINFNFLPPLKYIIPASSMGVFVYIIDKITPPTILYTLIGFILGVVWYFGIMIIQKDIFVLKVVNTMKNFFNHFIKS